MIKINGSQIEDKRFPDGTLAPAVKSFYGESITINWFYDNDSEMAHLFFLTEHFKSLGYKVELYIPYLPNARMDRVHDKEEIFTLKHFCKFINQLGFSSVHVLDVHSNVAAALIDNFVAEPVGVYISQVVSDLNIKDLVCFYPDAGAAARYSDMINKPYTFGVKHRDWKTGEIQSYLVAEPDVVRDKEILIIDDISSKGGTFYFAAKALREVGVKDIYLYVTHCEDTIHKGKLLEGDLIKRIYTTNSILRTGHKKIKMMEVIECI